jgi:hypothetical protein
MSDVNNIATSKVERTRRENVFSTGDSLEEPTG